jgi:hypothetical protein
MRSQRLAAALAEVKLSILAKPRCSATRLAQRHAEHYFRSASQSQKTAVRRASDWQQNPVFGGLSVCYPDFAEQSAAAHGQPQHALSYHGRGSLSSWLFPWWITTTPIECPLAPTYLCAARPVSIPLTPASDAYLVQIRTACAREWLRVHTTR